MSEDYIKFPPNFNRETHTILGAPSAVGTTIISRQLHTIFPPTPQDNPDNPIQKKHPIDLIKPPQKKRRDELGNGNGDTGNNNGTDNGTGIDTGSMPQIKMPTWDPTPPLKQGCGCVENGYTDSTTLQSYHPEDCCCTVCCTFKVTGQVQDPVIIPYSNQLISQSPSDSIIKHPTKKDCGCRTKKNYEKKFDNSLRHHTECLCELCREIKNKRKKKWKKVIAKNIVPIVPPPTIPNLLKLPTISNPLGVADSPPPSGFVAPGGGPLINNVKVTTIFTGDYPLEIASHVNDFFDYILQSRYMTSVNEYFGNNPTIGTGHGILINSFFDQNTFTDSKRSIKFVIGSDQVCIIEEADIVGYIKQLIDDNLIVTPTVDNNNEMSFLYFIYLPETVNGINGNFIKVHETSNAFNSCELGGYCGFHSYTDEFGVNLYYAIVPYPSCRCRSCGSCMMGQSTYRDALTVTSSHELMEAITDPTGGGWSDPSTGNEIGDWCGGQFLATDTIGSYAVQKIWSQHLGSCISQAPVNQLTLSDTCFQAPAIAVDESKQIFVLAWTGTNPGHNLNILSSINLDGNRLPSFGSKTTLSDSSLDRPAIAFTGPDFLTGERLFMAWRAYTDAGIFIKSAPVNDLTNFTGVGDGRTADTTDYAPVLAYFNGVLFLAWIANESGKHRNIFIAASKDGENWENRIRTGEYTDSAPSLSVIDGKLILLWRGYSDNSLDLFMGEIIMNQQDGNISLSDRVELKETSPYSPHLIEVNGECILSWRSNDDDRSLFLTTSTNQINGFTHQSSRYEIQTRTNFPMVDNFMGRPFIAWQGISDSKISIADLSDLVPL